MNVNIQVAYRSQQRGGGTLGGAEPAGIMQVPENAQWAPQLGSP